MASKGKKKQLSVRNILEPEDVSLWLTGCQSGDAAHPPSWGPHIEDVLRERLSTGVPEDIREIVEVAQATMAYGVFYYPLYTVGAERLYFALEAALKQRARQAGMDGKNPGFARCLKYLEKDGIVDPKDFRFTAMRMLRNSAAHPDFQTVFTPVMALGVLNHVCEAISGLFTQQDGARRLDFVEGN